MIRSAIVVSNPRKKGAAKLKKEVERFLREKGIKIGKDGDVLITVSGDGTILFNINNYNKPIFGIGGESSFICQAKKTNWRKKLAKILKFYRIEKRMLLSSELNGKKLPDALNEVCIRSSTHRLLLLKLNVEGKKYNFRADGIIFSTPTGSTAYCYSAGGVELPKNAKAYEIAGLAPFRRSFKPLIVNENAISKLRVEAEKKAEVIIDGQFIFPLGRKSNLKVYKSKREAEFLI